MTAKRGRLTPHIVEGTDQYTLFRLFSILMLFTICFTMILGIRETRINRETGYKNRSVSCATLAGAINGLSTQQKSSPFLNDVFKRDCVEDTNISERYPNVSAR